MVLRAVLILLILTRAPAVLNLIKCDGLVAKWMMVATCDDDRCDGWMVLVLLVTQSGPNERASERPRLRISRGPHPSITQSNTFDLKRSRQLSARGSGKFNRVSSTMDGWSGGYVTYTEW